MIIGPYHIVYPAFLLLLLLVPVLIVIYILWYRKSSASIGLSSSPGFLKMPVTFRQRLIHWPFAFRMMAVAFIVMALTQPESRIERQDVTVEGIDILLASDISGSMLAEDFKPNRLSASREVAMQFIDGRPDDRIGLIIFSAESFLQCPLTIDHNRLKSLYAQVKSGMVTDGTAIGDGLGLAVYHLMKSEAISKVVILLTDGVNNTGSLDPLTAAEIARKFGVRVYTIGVGSKGTAPYPFQTPFGVQYQQMEVQIDENLLSNIAETTGGRYFRATSKEKLEEIYREIDRMEKSKIDVTRFSKGKPEFLIFVIAAALMILFEFIFKNIIVRRIP